MEDEGYAVEGDIYRLQECAESAMGDFARADTFISEVIKEKGLKQTAERLASIMRRRCGNEANQTFTITMRQLEESMIELRKNLLSETIEALVKKGLLDVSVDKGGNLCFEAPKGGGVNESEKP